MRGKKWRPSLIWGMMVTAFFLTQADLSLGAMRVGVALFQMEQVQGEKIVRCPACGTVLGTGPIEGDPSSLLTHMLWDFLQGEKKGIDWISPGQVEGAYNTKLAKGIEKNPMLLMKTLGIELKADFMLWGNVFHYQERKGTSYAVQEPASVALDLHLLRVKDGKLVWRAQWAETQKSLSENLLEIDSFFKRKMRWLTVQELSRQSLEEILKDFPSPESFK